MNERSNPTLGDEGAAVLHLPALASGIPAPPPASLDPFLDGAARCFARHGIKRTSAEVAGEPLAQGEAVVVLQGGANRDPERFDHPEMLDIGRTDNAPVSFGWGIHHCLGAALARMEGEVVFNALLRRCRTIESHVDEPEWRPTLTLRGLATLPVTVAA